MGNLTFLFIRDGFENENITNCWPPRQNKRHSYNMCLKETTDQILIAATYPGFGCFLISDRLLAILSLFPLFYLAYPTSARIILLN
jgi:hypothetical protein